MTIFGTHFFRGLHRVLFGDGRGDRYLHWPIRLGWSRRSCCGLLDWHGWQVGFDVVAPEKTSYGCVPGARAVFGWTLHFGALKLLFGPARGEPVAPRAPRTAQ